MKFNKVALSDNSLFSTTCRVVNIQNAFFCVNCSTLLPQVTHDVLTNINLHSNLDRQHPTASPELDYMPSHVHHTHVERMVDMFSLVPAVWFLEYDVGWTGNLANILLQNVGHQEDFIG